MKSPQFAVKSSEILIELRQLSDTSILASLGEDVISLSLSTLLIAAVILKFSVEVGGDQRRSAIVVELLQNCPIIMSFGTWTCSVDVLFSNMRNRKFGITSIVPFAGKLWR